MEIAIEKKELKLKRALDDKFPKKSWVSLEVCAFYHQELSPKDKDKIFVNIYAEKTVGGSEF